MFFKRRLTAAAACLLAVAGCAGSTTGSTVRPTVASVKAAVDKACSPADFAMQCALPRQPLPELIVKLTDNGVSPHAATDGSIYGIDFAWGAPSVSGMQALGARFGASYFSYDPGKNWTADRVRAYHAAGIATVGVWETSATRAEQGYSAGQSDAINDRVQARGVGVADNRPHPFAIDCDCTGPQVASYFQGADSVLGAQNVDAYGGYYPLLWLYQHGLVGHFNWQTYAWSGGLWLSGSIAPLEQYLNGNSFDNDRAIRSDYGQFPAPYTGPSSGQIRSWSGARDVSLRHYHRQHCTLPVLGPRSCGLLAWRVVHFQALTQQHVACFGRHARPGAAVCQVIRPSVAVWSRARDSSKRASTRLGCGAYHSPTFGRPDPAACRTLGQRARFFDHKASGAVRAYV